MAASAIPSMPGGILVSGQVASADVSIPSGGVFFGKPYRATEIVDALNRRAARGFNPARRSPPRRS
ncbi:hypothetical protein HUU61_19250 [Rhodopseudomonas palustris]|nr:hypothetical protein [Rhodopseudomonas palustris]